MNVQPCSISKSNTNAVNFKSSYVTLSEKGELFLAESFLKVRSDFAEVLKRADYNDLLELKTALEKVLKNN